MGWHSDTGICCHYHRCCHALHGNGHRYQLRRTKVRRNIHTRNRYAGKTIAGVTGFHRSIRCEEGLIASKCLCINQIANITRTTCAIR